jgi:hypothetical protein
LGGIAMPDGYVSVCLTMSPTSSIDIFAGVGLLIGNVIDDLGCFVLLRLQVACNKTLQIHLVIYNS